MQKTIVAKQAETKNMPFNYTSPLDTMIKIKVADGEILPIINDGLLANDGNEATFLKIYEKNFDAGNLKFSRLGFSAGFKSLFSSIVQSGTYGLKIYLYTKSKDEDGNEIDVPYELNYSSQEMFGNPYNFETYFIQEKVFDISEIPEFHKVVVYFYQSNNFKDELGAAIPYSYTLEDSIETKYPNNLFVSNLNIYYGYDQKEFNNDKILLLNSSGNYYDSSSSDEQTKDLSINWIHKIDDNNYTLIESANNEYGTFKADWYIYDGKTLSDSYAGIGWSKIQDSIFSIKYTPDKTKQDIKIKVVGTFTPADDVGVEGAAQKRGQHFYSNIITLQNAVEIPSSATLEATNALEIFFNDGTSGNYFLYDQNGKIINDSEGPNRIRSLSVRFKGEPINNSLGNIEYLIWYLPNPSSVGANESTRTSMINLQPTDSSIKVEQIKFYNGLNYTKYTIFPDQDGTFKKLLYSISNILTPMKINNTIRCELKLNGVIYSVNKELMFAKMGTNGSNFNFMLNFAGGANGIEMPEDPDDFISSGMGIQVDALLFNSTTGESIKINEEDLIWECENLDKLISEKNHCSFDLPWGIVLDSTQPKNINNYSIVKCTYKYGNSIKLEAYLPIPYILKGYVFIEGAKGIEYNHQGNPYYYKDPYKIFNYNYESITKNIGWELKYNGKVVDYVNISDSYYATTDLVDNKIKKYLPSFVTGQIGGITYASMRTPMLYLVGYDKNICVNCVLTNSSGRPQKVLWSQPILITQSSYDFSMLNNWDGSLQIDEEGNTILAAMLGAGKKNNDNTFSGVLIGDIKEGTDKEDTEALTGVYGINHGVLSYGLREDGTAFLGRKGRGQILFDGESGTIKSSEWENGQGLLLDIDQGVIDSKGKNGQRFYLNPQKVNDDDNDFDLKIWGKGGQENTLLNITTKNNKEEYYIQSAGFTNESGTKLDLANGTFESYSSQGGLRLKSDPGNKESYFNVFAKAEDNSDINLIEMGNNGYYLQSAGYAKRSSIKKVGNYSVYQYSSSTPFIYSYAYKLISSGNQNYQVLDDNNSLKIENGQYIGLTSDSLIVKIKKDNGNYTIDGEKLEFTGRQVPTGTKITVDNKAVDTYNEVIGNEYDVNVDTVKKEFINLLKEVLNDNNDSQGTGLKIDLQNGIIDGYGLYLRGQTNKGSFVLDSTAIQSPFIIKDKDGKTNFSVDWDGTLTSTKVNSLNNDGRNNNAISISNNFYVDKKGNVGGGYANFGGGWFGGTAALSNKAASAQRADSADNATYVTYIGNPGGTMISTNAAANKLSRITGEGTEWKFNGEANTANTATYAKILKIGTGYANNLAGSLLELKDITSTEKNADGTYKKYTVLEKK